MSFSNPIKPFGSFFAEEQHLTQTEMIDKGGRKRELIIGIPKETTMMENRIALVPNSIRVLQGHGHRVVVEKDAGLRARYSDHDFSEAGAQVTADKKRIFEADVIIKIQPPTIEEIELLTHNQLILSQLTIPTMTKEWINSLQRKHVTATAMEYMQTAHGEFPIVRSMSQISGTTSITVASELLCNYKEGGRGVMLGSIAGVPPTKVVILGAGETAEAAARTALAMGAAVRIFDHNISKLADLETRIGRPLHTSTFNPVYLGYQLLSADVVIAALHSETGRAPVIVTEEMVSKMKKGSVIIDLSIDQGGCVETSEVCTHTNPTFVKHGVIHYCVPNVPSKVSRTASIAISNILVPLLLKMGNARNVGQMLSQNHGLRTGTFIYKGRLTNEYLSKRFDLKYTDLNLLLTSEI